VIPIRRSAFFSSFLLLVCLFLQLAPAFSQDLVWAHRTGSSGEDNASAIATDSSGNVYTVGTFENTVDFDPGPGISKLSSPGNSDGFIAKYDSSGDLVWVKPLGGSGDAAGFGVAVDASGNVYATGFFGGTIDFDPGVGTFNLSAKGEADIFVTKFDSVGNFIWGKQFGGIGGDESGAGIAIDGSGNVLTTGVFTRPGDFDPGPGVFDMTAAGFSDIFVSKLSSDGNFVWAKRMGGPTNRTQADISDVGFGIAVDAVGNFYTTGLFLGTADFDPGEGVMNLTSAGSFDSFVTKFAPDGALLWARQLSGPSEVGALALALDANANVYTTGAYASTADFDPGVGVSNTTAAGKIDAFVSKLDTNGNFVWVRSVGGPGAEAGSSGLAVDAGGNVYTSGIFGGTVDFDPGIEEFKFSGGSFGEGFLSKLNADGSFAWAIKIAGSGEGLGGGLALNGTNIYAAGSFDGNVDFDPGPGVTLLKAVGEFDFFIAKLTDNSSTGLSPVISSGGIVLSTLLPNVSTISPGSIISVFGQNFSSQSIFLANLDGNGEVARILGGTCLEMNGERLPMFAVTPTQINAQASAAQVLGPASFTVISDCDTPSAALSKPVTIRAASSGVESATVEAATPGFFVFSPVASDGFIAARFNATAEQPPVPVAPTSLFPNDSFGPSRPAQPGDIIVMYGTGWGATEPSFGTGELATGAAALPLSANVVITFGGVVMDAADVLYVGVTPNTAGLLQAVIRIPANAQSGNNQVVLSAYGKSTPVGPVVPVVVP
jgi:uncharacterized protein (TIGR03437 family)